MKRRSVIITRPEPGLSETMAAVQDLGWIPVACPMLEIKYYPPLDERDYDAVLITSANSLRALQTWSKQRPLITVGQKTAERAKNIGFLNVYPAGGDAKSLVKFCYDNNFIMQKLLLVSGHGYGHALSQELQADRVEAYEVMSVKTLSFEAQKAFLEQKIHGVCFYSTRTAQAFESALQASYSLGGVKAFCLSRAIAETLSPRQWEEIVWPDPLVSLGPYET